MTANNLLIVCSIIFGIIDVILLTRFIHKAKKFGKPFFVLLESGEMSRIGVQFLFIASLIIEYVTLKKMGGANNVDKAAFVVCIIVVSAFCLLCLRTAFLTPQGIFVGKNHLEFKDISCRAKKIILIFWLGSNAVIN